VIKNRHGDLPHILLTRGQEILEKLFPGIIQNVRYKSMDLEKREGNCEESTGNEHDLVMLNYFNSGEKLKLVYASGEPLTGVTKTQHNVTIVSRGLWESTIREYVIKQTPNLKVMDGYQVLANGKGIQTCVKQRDDNPQKFNVTVTGVVLQKVNGSEEGNSLLECDLLLNCGGVQTSTEHSNLLKGIESALIDPMAFVSPSSEKTRLTKKKNILHVSKINNGVRYQCFYFEPKKEAFDLYETLQNGLVKTHKRPIISPVTVAKSFYGTSSNKDEEQKHFYAFYHLLVHPNTKGVLCIPLEKNIFMINLITIADEERENNKRFCDGLTLDNAKDRIINMYAKGTSFEKDLTYVLSCMKDRPIRIPPPYEKEGNQYVHYEQLHHYKCDKVESFLNGFLAVGDSVSSMNPVYAQGMTCCFESVLILRDVLKNLSQQPRVESKPTFDYEFCNNFQKRIYYMYFIPWLLTSSDDIRYIDTEVDDPKQQHYKTDRGRFYSKRYRWQKKIFAPLLDLILHKVFILGSTTEIVSAYFFSILNMRDGFRYSLGNLPFLLRHVFRCEKKILFLSIVALFILACFLFYTLQSR